MEPEGEGEGLELGMEPEGEPHSLRPSRSVPFLPVGCPQSSGRRGACSRPGRSGRCTAASERWPSAPESPSFEDPGVVPRKMLMKIIKYYIYFFYSPSRSRVASPLAEYSLPPILAGFANHSR